MTHDMFCSRCGARLAHALAGPPKCPSCGRIAYQDPKLAAAAVIPSADGIVLVRRAIEPAYGKWSFPSGYVNRGEAVEHAVRREAFEETGLEVTVGWLVGLYSTVGSPVVLSVYHAEITAGTLAARDEALDARTFPVDSLPEMAFDHDAQILQDWLKSLRDRQRH